LTSPQDPSDARDDYAETSKRPRLGSLSVFPSPESQTPSPLAPRPTFAATRFEFPVVRELVNRKYLISPLFPPGSPLTPFENLVFFAHCHPHRLLFHQPTFMADVSLGRIPSYLLHALCALAAPFSKHPTVRTDRLRTAGLAYAKAAEEVMFDSHGRLCVDRNLMTAQALCLLESHQSLLSCPWPSPSTYHREFLGYPGSRHGNDDVAYSSCILELVLGILKEDLHIQDEYHNTLTSAPTTSFELDAIGRECARRTFWYIKLMHLTTFMYFQIPAPSIPVDLNLRLPVDEASFEFGAHNSQSGPSHSPLLFRDRDQCLIWGTPEYLHVPAPRTQYVSEYGHLLRIALVHARLAALNAAGSKVLLPCMPCSHTRSVIITARPISHDSAKVLEEAEQDISVRTPHWKPNNRKD